MAIRSRLQSSDIGRARSAGLPPHVGGVLRPVGGAARLEEIKDVMRRMERSLYIVVGCWQTDSWMIWKKVVSSLTWIWTQRVAEMKHGSAWDESLTISTRRILEQRRCHRFIQAQLIHLGTVGLALGQAHYSWSKLAYKPASSTSYPLATGSLPTHNLAYSRQHNKPPNIFGKIRSPCKLSYQQSIRSANHCFEEYGLDSGETELWSICIVMQRLSEAERKGRNKPFYLINMPQYFTNHRFLGGRVLVTATQDLRTREISGTVAEEERYHVWSRGSEQAYMACYNKERARHERLHAWNLPCNRE